MTSVAMNNSIETESLPSMCAAEVLDRLTVMRTQEQTTYRCDDYLNRSRMEELDSDPMECTNDTCSGEETKPVDEECRVKMCEWCYQVVDFCKFRRETVIVGMGYLDRYLCTSTPRARRALEDRKEYQLAAMTTLYMAIKLFEPLEMETTFLSQLSRGCYSSAEIAQMEIDILTALNWRVHGPSTISFIQYFLMLLPVAQNSSVVATLLDCARFQAELSVGDYYFATQPMSYVAIGSILNAMEGIGIHNLSNSERTVFIQQAFKATGIDIYSAELTEVRSRLFEIFAKSSGLETNEKCDEASMGSTIQKERSVNCGSPVCVSRRKGLVRA